MFTDGDKHSECLPILSASGIAEYIRFNCCPRFFKLKFGAVEIRNRKWIEAFTPISPLLYGAGKALEENKISELKEKAERYFDLSGDDPRVVGWESAWKSSSGTLCEAISWQFSDKEGSGCKPVLLYQVPMKGRIGVWDVRGIADLIGVWPSKDGKVKVRIFELKASWKEQTAHRIQVAIYVLLLSQELEGLSSNIEFEGGVINKETELENLDPDSLPKFKLGPLITDVERLLCADGELHRIHQTPLPKVEYQLCWRCDNCGFNECCIVSAVESESVALLNLTRGEQNVLRSYGIEKLEDLAKLKVLPNADSLRPYDFKGLTARDIKKVSLLATDPVIGARLDWFVQRSQFMLGGIRPSSPFASKSRHMPWLTGTGYGSLPEDSALSGSDSNLLFNPNGMIRVYLFVEWDYMLDVISMVSARVSCSRHRGDSLGISRVIGRLPDDRESCLDEEKKLLENFFLEVIQAIINLAVEVGSPDEAPIHLYFFSQRERDVLMDAVRRQPSLMSARAVRDLLGLRQAIDQPMFSIVQDEVVHRKALRFHSNGLLPILDQAGFFDGNEWIVKRRDGSLVDLRFVFRDGFFNYVLPYRRTSEGSISFILGFDRAGRKEGYYPARARFGDQIPIEYVWAAKGRLDNRDEKGLAKVFLEKRMWCDYPQNRRRITDEELALMGLKLCLALEHIERSLSIRNSRLGKKPIVVPKISEFSLGPVTLERSCREFLDLEYFAKRQEMYQHYALLPYQRVASGRSLIFECTGVEESEREFLVHGRLVYEGFGVPKADCVANACRVKGSEGYSSGDWMVVTEIRRNEAGQFEEVPGRSPSEVERSARAIVDQVDPRKLELILKVISWPSGRKRKYSAWHNLPTSDPDKAKSRYMQLFEVGRWYILDEFADDIISDRAAKCLDYANSNVLYCLLEVFLAGKSMASHAALPQAAASSFLSWVEGRGVSPNVEQKRFVNRVFGEEAIIMLQGPPGTGKTETLQLAVLAHVAADRADSRCRVLMVAPTHKAIHEFVSKLACCWREYCSDGGKDLEDLRIYRVLSSDVSAIKPLDGVKYVNYHEDLETVEELAGCMMRQKTLVSNASSFPLVLCATPPGLYGLMKKIGGSEPPWGEGFFDLLVVDEASMMRLPEFILSGSFLCKTSQILVAGDHRQLPPIQAHNWEKEDRRTLEELASFLSAMDFLRLLRMEDLGIDRIKRAQGADIPTERLCESHRCHTVVADFLKEWVYEKDKIDFRSAKRETIDVSEPKTDGLRVALDPGNVFVLIVHDEAKSFQSNSIEASIVEALVHNVRSDSVGVITPHNAQKGLLKNILSEGYENVRVDTVEKYQGGSADFIIISSTVSDPDYVRCESDFLLNLNRINVAISRMKKKLVIVASKSIFDFMPQDAKDYDKALLWRGISQTVGFTAKSKPQWTGTLSELLGKQVSPIKIEIYVKSEKGQK